MWESGLLNGLLFPTKLYFYGTIHFSRLNLTRKGWLLYRLNICISWLIFNVALTTLSLNFSNTTKQNIIMCTIFAFTKNMVIHKWIMARRNILVFFLFEELYPIAHLSGFCLCFDKLNNGLRLIYFPNDLRNTVY